MFVASDASCKIAKKAIKHAAKRATTRGVDVSEDSSTSFLLRAHLEERAGRNPAFRPHRMRPEAG
jgi:hypothetical protein